MRGFMIAVALVVAVVSARAQESIPLETMTAIKDATVMITTTVEGDADKSASGSGFLIRVEGKTAFFVTNNHVIDPGETRDGAKTKLRVILRSGTKQERSAAAEVVAASAERDLAILKTSTLADLPQPIDIDQIPELVETMQVYMFGFPFGKALAMGRGSPSVVIGRGMVSSVRRDDKGEAYSVLIDGALNPGNSGGPVVDVKGRLVGIAVATIRGANIGIAIAPAELNAMLLGKPDAINFALLAKHGESVDLAVDAPLFDPLNRINKLEFLYVMGNQSVSREGKTIKPLAGASKVALKVSDRRGSATIAVKPAANGNIDLTYQIAYGDGKRGLLYTKPIRYVLAPTLAAKSAHGSKKGAKTNLQGDVIDPDGDCEIRIEDGAIAIEVPGTHHDLNASIGKFNAPRVLREVNGDFEARVKVTGDFQPEEPTTRDGAFPYHGAGLVVWVDQDRHCRVERGAVFRNGQIGAFLLFERREAGDRTVNENGALSKGDVYLKITRKGSRVTAASSKDGVVWTRSRPVVVDWPARVKVGLEAVNSAFSPLSVRFEEFSLDEQGRSSKSTLKRR